jgi:hypothetical protein
MLMKVLQWLSALAVVAMLAPAPVTAGSTERYRLAGVMAVGPEYLGILQLPDGGQMLVRKGSVLEGGARVLLLDATRARIALPGKKPFDIALDGSGGLPEVSKAQGVVQEQSDHHRALIRRVDPDAFRAAAKLSVASAGMAAPVGAKTSDPTLETALRLAPILNLPPNSRIVAVNEQPVRSAEQVIRTIQKTLDQGMPPRLNLANNGREYRVYIKPPES